MIQYQLTEQHGRAILKIPEEEIQLELLDHIAQKELTVKQTEELVAEIMEQMCQPKQKHIQKKKDILRIFAFLQTLSDNPLTLLKNLECMFLMKIIQKKMDLKL